MPKGWERGFRGIGLGFQFPSKSGRSDFKVQATEGARMSTVYRARTIKRDRRTKAQIERVDEQILDVLATDHPQWVRHVFYRMTVPRLAEPVEKSDRGYRHVQHRCAELRRAGRLPYGWSSDATRHGYFVDTFTSAADFVRRMAGYYRADLWTNADHYSEVWVESRSIAGVVQDDCQELAVSLYPAGGFSSITLAYQAAEYINESSAGKPVTIFYVGDYDPAGVLLDVALKRELCTQLDDDIELDFERISITSEQIALHDLPFQPRKTTD